MVPEPASASDVAARPGRAPLGLIELAWSAAAIVIMLAYRAMVERYYGSSIPQGTGMAHIVAEEIAQLTLYVAFGLAAGAALTMAFRHAQATDRALALATAATRRPWPVVAGLAALVFFASLGTGRLVLGGSATTDDEHVYRFIAQTLETGSLTAPSPGTDLDFYREQFVVLTPQARYGKYPIGHPLLLALGELAGAAAVVPPLASAGTLLLAYAAGRRILGVPSALLGTFLLATSPHFVLTGGTWLSQVTSTLALSAALAAVLAAGDGPHRRWWLAAGGAALGYGFLIRPMPHGALAVAGVLWLLARPRRHPWRPRVAGAIAFGVPVALGVGTFLLVNRVQTGAALTSGYQAFHGSGEGLKGLWAETLGVDLAGIAASVFAAVFRENVWLLGWPVSLLPCLLARRTRATAPLWGIVGVALAYRLLLPKAGVSPTGPVYFSEAVPALCLLAADGLRRLGRGETAVGALLVRLVARPRPTVAAGAIAGFATSLALFTPARLVDLGRMAGAQDVVERLAREQGAHHALVFHRGAVPPWTRLSWAYFPRCNSPSLEDDILFVRQLEGTGVADPNVTFWRDRHPDRRAFVFAWPPGQPATLVELGNAPPPSAPERP